jgi:exopolysaccharide biosynthesis protein
MDRFPKNDMENNSQNKDNNGTDHNNQKTGSGEKNKMKQQAVSLVKNKRMPIWLLILTDVLLAAAFLGIFTLYLVVLPQRLKSENIVLSTVEDTQENNFTLPSNSASDTSDGEDADSSNVSGENSNTENSNSENSTDSETGTATSSAGSSSETTDSNARTAKRGKFSSYSNTNTDNIAADTSESSSLSAEEKTVTQMKSYNSDNIQFTVNKYEAGTGNDKITYYVSDIYVTNVKYLKTAFATGEYGKNLREEIPAMATENNAILAINGDYYGNNETSVVIRNGVLYRSTSNDADICVLFTDGTMKTYLPDEFDADDLIDQGAWQAWTFGPSLLDGNGNILSSFNTTDYIYSEHPRTSIGYVEPGHYVFVVVDGRNPGYSKGASLNELAQIMVDAGCKTAFNLDGGGSSAMVYDGEYITNPSNGDRAISDIIYLGE